MYETHGYFTWWFSSSSLYPLPEMSENFIEFKFQIIWMEFGSKTNANLFELEILFQQFNGHSLFLLILKKFHCFLLTFLLPYNLEIRPLFSFISFFIRFLLVRAYTLPFCPKNARDFFEICIWVLFLDLELETP